MDDDRVALERARSTSASSDRVAGTRITADHPPSAGSTVAPPAPASDRPQRRVVRSNAIEDPLAARPLRARAGGAPRSGPASTPTDTCRRSAPGDPALRRRRRVRSLERDPSELHLWQADALRQPAEPAQQAAGGTAKARGSTNGAAQRVVAEHLVEDQRGARVAQRPRQLIRVGVAERPSRSDCWDSRRGRRGSRASTPRSTSVEIDRPPAVILQRVAPLSHAVEARQVIEERIAGDRRQHAGTAGLAQELEEHRIRFTGAGRQHDPIRVDRQTAPGVVRRDRLARVRAGRTAPAGRSAPPRSRKPGAADPAGIECRRAWGSTPSGR